ncbi:MAG: ribosomal protein S18-alanine N-acetyltransferase [Hyphomicrobiales bacterium]|nr:ribosomal protein S18-alanine N-acetyltransferase [Hyphomicrobiales bacterium]
MPLEVADAETLAEIHADTFVRAWSADEFAAMTSDSAVFGLGLRRDGFVWPARMLGFVLLRVAVAEAEVLTIAVRTARQGRGLGRFLMDEALRQLYREGVESCFLEVDRDNQPAVHLYQTLGFEVVGERKGYYYHRDGPAATALVMRLRLR